jgi:hypothetical protein
VSRTTAALVKGVLMRDYDALEGPDLTPFIDTASAIVDMVAAQDAPPGATLLELIERWLAAHCYCMSDQPYAQTKTESTGATFQGTTGMHLTATKYGQTAIALDTTGYLAGLGVGRRRASFAWLGKRPSEQIPYDERS